jgi:hypothetical protein
MRRKKGNTNIKILQSQIQNFTIQEDKKNEEHKLNQKSEIRGIGAPIAELPVIEKIKKKGIKKDELINTRRLLTM